MYIKITYRQDKYFSRRFMVFYKEINCLFSTNLPGILLLVNRNNPLIGSMNWFDWMIENTNMHSLVKHTLSRTLWPRYILLFEFTCFASFSKASRYPAFTAYYARVQDVESRSRGDRLRCRANLNDTDNKNFTWAFIFLLLLFVTV